MTKAIARLALAIASIALSLTAVAPAFSQKGDMPPSPSQNAWALVNACREPVWVAILADGWVGGWVYLEPGGSAAFSNRDATIGVHALIGSQGTWWSPGGHGFVEMPVNMGGSFNYQLGAATPGMTPRTFILYDILARGGRVAICEQ